MYTYMYAITTSIRRVFRFVDVLQNFETLNALLRFQSIFICRHRSMAVTDLFSAVENVVAKTNDVLLHDTAHGVSPTTQPGNV